MPKFPHSLLAAILIFSAMVLRICISSSQRLNKTFYDVTLTNLAEVHIRVIFFLIFLVFLDKTFALQIVSDLFTSECGYKFNCI